MVSSGTSVFEYYLGRATSMIECKAKGSRYITRSEPASTKSFYIQETIQNRTTWAVIIKHHLRRNLASNTINGRNLDNINTLSNPLPRLSICLERTVQEQLLQRPARSLPLQNHLVQQRLAGVRVTGYHQTL